MKTKERKCDNILKRIVSGVLIVALTISMPIPYTAKNKTVKAETISREVEWNIKCLNAEKSYEESKNLKKIKVAILDSGLDYDLDLPAVERKDFLGEKELHPLYQDMTGHGTSVASLICARENEDRITGIAANVELYIGRIFGYGNNAPVERVVRAVNWAIEEKVNIIHMSFGTEEYSGELEDAIEKAYKSGILIIAAAGNAGQAPEDESTIEYPAAFDNVISVGSTNKYNNMSDFSATGKELDVVAPGDQILTDGAFGGVAVDKGTSISAAQVTGVAAVLWGKHPDKSNAFIKSLLVGSANKEAVNSEECGEGLIDYKEADKNYKEMNEAYKEYKEDGASEKKAVEKAEKEIPENTKSVEEHGEVNYVNASWARNDHELVVGNWEQDEKNNQMQAGDTQINKEVMQEANINYVKMGVVHSDSLEVWKGMKANPYFHGRGNYFANTQYLYCLARKYIENDKTWMSAKKLGVKKYKKLVRKSPNANIKKGNKNKKKKTKKEYKMIDPLKDIKAKINKGDCLTNYFKSFQNVTYWGMNKYPEEVRKKIETDKKAQGYVLLGATIHNLTDVFSHNVRKKTKDGYGGVWCAVVHRKKKKALEWERKMDEKYEDASPTEKGYLSYLYDNFAIADKREKADNPVNIEKMYALASEAGACVLASMDSKETWYSLLKTKLKKADIDDLKIRDINHQWKLLTGKKGKFKSLRCGKDNEPKEIKVSYSIKNYKKKRWIEICAENAYGNTVKVDNKIVYKKKFKGNLVRPSKIKGKQIKIKSYRGFEVKDTMCSASFKIKYSCKGMKNVKLKKGQSRETQIATIGKDVTFVPKGTIFEKTKGKKELVGWHLKGCTKHPNKKKNHVDYTKNKKVKYPVNKGDTITLCPVFK